MQAFNAGRFRAPTSAEAITLRNIRFEKGASDKKQYNSALKMFNTFIKDKYGPEIIKSSDVFNAEGDILEEFVTGDMLGFFAGYCQDKMSAWSTAKNYYSQVKRYLEELYPNRTNEIQTASSKMQKKITSHFRDKCGANRTNLVNHHLPCTPEDNHYICHYLFKENKHEECLLQALDFHNGGRISEGRALLWNDFVPKSQIEQ